MEELKNRLVLRNTETPETLRARLDKAKEEIALQEHFDKAYVNDVLEDTIATIQKDIDAFLKA
jgi:guanylate kinase